MRRLWAAVIALLLSAHGAVAAEFIVLQSTTSTQNSGLLDAILPQFTKDSGIEVRVVAVGTGQALRNARNGDGDVLLVHARAAEDAFVREGFGVARFDVMYNDFVLVGPADDPAGIAGSEDALDAFVRLATARQRFVSRGDDSGTHQAELGLWEMAGQAPQADSGTWYIETGSGMGATLNVAVSLSAYAMTDRATWAAFGNKGSHKILFEGDERLFNQYGVIAIDPERHPQVKTAAVDQFLAWILGRDGQRAIADFRLDGQQVFFPNAAQR
ncbi:MAG: substrate-binding domain-containing protein [Paracoccaceae bacterium]|jgi:tungstate transport system substrate-binding protein|nr:substrate-binding domain-containing protein [Paracoccaceae bacterium]MDP7186614.1 substrate-binding domain-containing protein [Paracoccaceae bacterium]